MGNRGRIAGLLILAALLAIVAAGCGGGSNSDDGGSNSDASAADAGQASGSNEANEANADESNADESNEVEASTPSEGEPSRAFLTKKGENKIAKFGEEASAEEREAASLVLKENLDARESGDWATQCATLTPGAVKTVNEGAVAQDIGGGGCAKELQARAQPLQRTRTLRVNRMTGPIDALRFQGSSAYALYHGVSGVDYMMPMEKVDGEWKVGDILDREP